MRIMCMSGDVDGESIFVKNVESVARNPACWKSISGLTLMYGLIYASCVILPSKQKVPDQFYCIYLFAGLMTKSPPVSLTSILRSVREVFLNQGSFYFSQGLGQIPPCQPGWSQEPSKSCHLLFLKTRLHEMHHSCLNKRSEVWCVCQGESHSA